MITKISRIQNLGCFDENIWTDDSLIFKRLNLFFGQNGSGKTMLSNVIRLFAEDVDATALVEHLKAKSTEAGGAEVISDGKKLKAPGASQKLRVFNSNFVAEHVYDGTVPRVKRFKGDVVTTEQLKNPQIKKLEDAVRRIEAKQKAVEADLGSLQSTAKSIRSALSTRWNKAIADYRLPMGLDMSNNVPQQSSSDTQEVLESKLEEQFQSYRLSKRRDDLTADITSLDPLENVTFRFSFDAVPLLQKKISESALKSIRAKLDKYKHVNLANGSPQQWFEDGLTLLNASTVEQHCPLCDSHLPQIRAIIEQYNAFFSEEFATLRSSLSAMSERLVTILSVFGQAEKMASTVQNLADKYQLIEKLGQDTVKSLKEFTTRELEDDVKRMQQIVDQKAGHLDNGLTTEEIEFVRGFAGRLEALEESWALVNDGRSRLRGLLAQASFNEGEAKDIAKSHFWKAFDVGGAAHATTCQSSPIPPAVKKSGLRLYWHLRSLASSLETDSARVRQERNDLLIKLRSESRYVNRLLPSLGVTNFTIKMSDHDDDDIEVVYRNGVSKHGVRYSLSDGEKTALAFAYFLSKIQHEIINNDQAELSDYVIVIDDPVSSLDDNRLSATAMLIRNMFVGKARQLFVLSHNLVFLKHFSSSLQKQHNVEREDFFIDRGLISKLPQPLENFQTSYFYKLSKIRAFLDGEFGYEIGKDYLPSYIRMVLETFLAFKLCRLKHDSGTLDKYKSAGLESLIGSVSGLNLNDHQAVGTITGKDELVNCLWNLKRQVDPEVHGSTQDLTEFEYLSEKDLRSCCQVAVDVIAFLDRIHFDNSSARASQSEQAKSVAPSDNEGVTTDQVQPDPTP